MLYLLLSLLFIGLLTALLTSISRQKDDAVVLPTDAACDTCSGVNAKCEQECMLEAAVGDIEYYDDEELDRFREKAADQYDESEVDEFAQILHTMRQEDVAGWCRSLTLRGINLPNELKDETLMLINDAGSR